MIARDEAAAVTPVQGRRTSRLIAALAALAVNGLLFGALTGAGPAAAERAGSAAPASAAASAPEVKKPAPAAQTADDGAAVKRKPRPTARKLLPVHDFGGY